MRTGIIPNADTFCAMNMMWLCWVESLSTSVMTIMEGEVIKKEVKHQICESLIDITIQKMKFPIKGDLLRKYLMDHFVFCVMCS